MQKRKIAIVTGTRADYGLLQCLLSEVQKDVELELQVIVTGMHLSPEFGLTFQHIEKDGFAIAAKVEMLLSSDTAVGIAKSMGICIIGIADELNKLKPDLIVILGDRFEALAIAQAALILKIPIAHIHGGELSTGALDDSIRHAITKMSQLHFVATEKYRQRVIQLGENPNRVFNIGTPGLERIDKMQFHNPSEIETIIGLNLQPLNFLVTYHPATMNIDESNEIFQNLLASLDQFPEARIIFTKANADEAGRYINDQIDKYAAKNLHRVAAFTSLGDLTYLSLLNYVTVIIGNSSSGLIEAPYLKKPTINIGNRQDNRLRASSIIDCSGMGNTIVESINRAISSDFQHQLKYIRLEYKKDSSARKIATTLKNIPLKGLTMKTFYDLPL